MKIFLDANILFLAGDETSATRKLIDLVAGRGQLITNTHAWVEATRNLTASRRLHVPGLLTLKPRLAFARDAFLMSDEARQLSCDGPVMAGAIATKCSHLWTSDRVHFDEFFGKTLEGVKIVSSLMLAQEIGVSAGFCQAPRPAIASRAERFIVDSSKKQVLTTIKFHQVLRETGCR